MPRETAWLWSRADMANSVDVLFVDEAGQMSLANALAVSQAATRLVLLGDPQQLDQPQRGVHPPDTDVSALAHLLKIDRPSRRTFMRWVMHHVSPDTGKVMRIERMRIYICFFACP
jgi:hypothetical protein